jgi:hypothetical protein
MRQALRQTGFGVRNLSFALEGFVMACNPVRDFRLATAKAAEPRTPWHLVTACSALMLLAPLAHGASGGAAVDSVTELRATGHHAAAAELGLAQLLTQPWDHQLRLAVADSLRQSGRAVEAVAQLEALEGTALADVAQQRLAALEQQALGAGAASKDAVAPDAGPPDARSAAPAPRTVVRPAPGVNVAQAAVPSTGPAATTPGGAVIQIAPFQYIPPPRMPVEPTPPRTPEQQRLAALYSDGNYEELGTEGLALLRVDTPDDELRLRIANSLSWTGRLKEATPIYEALLPGKYGADARLALANIQRWSGEDHLAAAGYRQVLAAQPTNADALTGLKLAQRALRPRTVVRLGGGKDSNDITHRSLVVNHRWREAGDMRIWEVEAAGVRDERAPLAQSASQGELGVRYTALDVKLRPSFELSTTGHKAFAQLTLTGQSVPVSVQVGRVNWARMAVTPGALSAQLTASHMGVQASVDGKAGSFVGRADYYGISDGNRIVTSSLQYTPRLRPLGPHVKPLLGVETRHASDFSQLYWSPTEGYGSVFAGLLADWGGDDWSVFGSAQYGRRLYGEGGPSWSASLGGKRWISDDWAVHANFWAYRNWRSGSRYQARAFVLAIERLWQ